MGCVGFDGRIFYKEKRNKGKEQHGDDGVQDFTEVILCPGITRLNLPAPHPPPEEHVTDKKSYPGDTKIPCADILKDREIIIPFHTGQS
jgi:hypothetical protein